MQTPLVHSAVTGVVRPAPLTATKRMEDTVIAKDVTVNDGGVNVPVMHPLIFCWLPQHQI